MEGQVSPSLLCLTIMIFPRSFAVSLQLLDSKVLTHENSREGSSYFIKCLKMKSLVLA